MRAAEQICIIGTPLGGASNRRTVIWDDDFCADPDGASTLTLLLQLERQGFCTIAAMTANSANAFSAPAMKAIAKAQGRTGIPIGAYQGSSVPSTSAWTFPITQWFGVQGDTRANYPAAVTTLRTALAASSGNVHYISTGFLNNLAALLQSAADGISPLTGAQLVAAKVSEITIMGGDYPSGTESNFSNDPVSAAYVFNNSPVPIVSVGFTMGNAVNAGPPGGANPFFDPVAYAFPLGSAGGSRPCWDSLAVLYGCVGLKNYFTVAGANGTNTVNSSTGANSWSASPTGNDSYLANVSASALSAYITSVLAAMTLPVVAPTAVTFYPAKSVPTLSNGNLTATATTGAVWTDAIANAGFNAGKFYCEFTANSATANALIGIINGNAILATNFPGVDFNGIGYDQNGAVIINGSVVSTLLTWTTGAILSMAVDFGNNEIWFRVGSGNWNNSGTANPATNVGGISISSLIASQFFIPVVAPKAVGDGFTANFGATAYAESVPAGFGNW